MSKPPSQNVPSNTTTTTTTKPPSGDNPPSNPNNPQFAASTLDFLLIELVPTVQRTTQRVLAREREFTGRGGRSGTGGGTTVEDDGEEEDGGGGEPKMTSLGFPAVTERTREAMLARLDGIGYRVGQGLVERFSPQTPRPLTPLDAIKFICKDLWPTLHRKQIDNLKTNHRGIFVLSDARFQPLGRVSVDRRATSKEAGTGTLVTERAGLAVGLAAGVVRGALMSLGIEASVVGEVAEIPLATFTIKTKGAKA